MQQNVHPSSVSVVSRAVHFSALCSLIYLLPVLYAIGFNRALFFDYATMATLFFITHALLYAGWSVHPKADISGDKAQLLFYMGAAFVIVSVIALIGGLVHPEVVTVDRLFFGYVAMPILYGLLAVINYILFIRMLKIWQ